MNKKQHIFLVSWHFPPYKSSSAFNLFKRIKGLDKTFDVAQIKRDGPQNNVSMFEYSNAIFNRFEIDVGGENSRCESTRDKYIDLTVKLFAQLNKRNHYEIIFSHSHEFVSHLAAMKLKNEYPHLKWIASFGDPIKSNPYNKYYNFPLDDIDSQSEAEVIALADRIVVTNEYQKDFMIQAHEANHFKDKFSILHHCFDRRMYASSFKKNNVFTFMHIGMLYKFKRTSEPFILAAKHLLKKHPEYKDKFKIEFYGANDKYIKDAEVGDLSGTVSFNGSVSYLDSLKLMMEADALLLREADFEPDGLPNSPFYPGKLADYFAAQKPMISVGMKKGFVTDIFDKIKMPSLIEKDIKGISLAYKKIIDRKISPETDIMNEFDVESNIEQASQIFKFNKKKTILIAGHDLKFAKHIIEYCESNVDCELIYDYWKGHDKHDEEKSKILLNQADIIFCEWGLGNAVWYSNNKKPGQRLIVRLHLQEISTDYPNHYDINAIDAIVCVSPYWMEKFRSKFLFPRSKMCMIYNLIDVKSFDIEKSEQSRFNLGFIGMVPQRKRLDLALDVLEYLYAKDKRFKLYVLGKKPEDYHWMNSRIDEMEYYDKIYKRIKKAAWSKNVIFDGHTDNVAKWMAKIGWMLSTSDFESFHMAPAEGMASGTVPLLYEWPGVKTIYPDNFVFKTAADISKFVSDNHASDFEDELKAYAQDNFCSKKNAKSIVELFSW
ncbi:glycosyltransferase [Leclercia adecarboxylata]|uniref:glycosyltransferase n=1 Tax=Leclercia adecarboxylata TaxID=83655 RepID=UPI002DBF6339|nr:glycosyltransferase [Leclercia adecarboxylata]MEB6379760.1 glycosyltransferase [Leclercia adecarboxylata]